MSDLDQDSGSARSKKAVANHFLLDGEGGKVVDDMEAAHAIRFQHVATGETIDWQPKSEDAVRMLALFGAKTILTNTASGVRNRPAGGTPEEEVIACRERIQLIESGQFVDRTREGGGQKIDEPKMITAWLNVQISNGLYQESQRDEKFANLSKAVADGQLPNGQPMTASLLRQYPGVDAEYRKLMGRQVPDASALAAMI